MRTGVHCHENRFFPVGIDSKGVRCEPYRVLVCSDLKFKNMYSLFGSPLVAGGKKEDGEKKGH